MTTFTSPVIIMQLDGITRRDKEKIFDLLTVSIVILYCSRTQYSIPSNTAIYQSAAAFVFVISVPLLKERVTLMKVSRTPSLPAGVPETHKIM